MFDYASTTTLIHRDLVRRRALHVILKGTFQLINGIGGKTRSEEGELELTRSDGTVVRVNVNIVDDIITTKKQDDETASRLAHYSANILNKDQQYEDVRAKNFQQSLIRAPKGTDNAGRPGTR